MVILDVKTQWNLTFDMITILLNKLEDFCDVSTRTTEEKV